MIRTIGLAALAIVAAVWIFLAMVWGRFELPDAMDEFQKGMRDAAPYHSF